MANLTKTNDTLHGLSGNQISRYFKSAGFRDLIKQSLAEDIGSGDLTSCIFSPKDKGKAYLLAKADGILSGTAVVNEVFRQLDRSCKVRWNYTDGQPFKEGDSLAQISGPMRSLLQGERLALNFIQRLSGIATMTGKFVTITGKSKKAPGIYDTRKTTPMLRALEKKAVFDGGGKNHRFALYDMAMLKNNHIDAAGGISEAVQKLKDDGFYNRRPRLGLCIEARNLDEAVEATWCGADIIMLDNMTPTQIKKSAEAVSREAKNLNITMPELEISGGITLKNLTRYAKLPVQRISVGALTHSAPALDISMRYLK